MNAIFCFRPQAPGGAHPCALAASHKLGRALALAVGWTPTGSLVPAGDSA